MTHYPGMSLKKEDYYAPENLICGQYVKIYNRDCFIYNCDASTREWYINNLGIEQK